MRLAILALLFAAASTHAAAACPPADYPRPRLEALKAAKWVLADDTTRNKLALSLAGCLSDPDPFLRDDVAFEALYTWMRGDKIDTSTVRKLRDMMMADLTAADPQGFKRPFAVLVLAEVARIDRLKPYLSADERVALVRAGSEYLQGVRDYRGFHEKEGWRHGVAHASDLMLQLALNPALDKKAHETILAAIASQVMPASGHSYITFESGRLAAPVFFLAARDTLSTAEWETWFTQLGETAKIQAPFTEAMMARVHNLKSFLLPLYRRLVESKDEAQRARLLPIVTKTLKQFD